MLPVTHRALIHPSRRVQSVKRRPEALWPSHGHAGDELSLMGRPCDLQSVASLPHQDHKQGSASESSGHNE